MAPPLALVAGALLGACASGAGTPAKDAAPSAPAAAEVARCPSGQPLGSGDVDCRCGIETFKTFHWRSLDTYRRYADGVIWLCTERRQLKVTLESELLEERAREGSPR